MIRMLAALLFAAWATTLWAQPAPHPANPHIQSIIEQISADSIFAYISRLSAFHTRHTFSDTTGDSIGIGATLRWVESRVESYNEEYTTEWFPWVGSFQGNPRTRHDLIARAAGTGGGARYVIGGHIDSRNASINDNTGFAPGADDNGSSSAALLELLRLLPDSLAHDLEVIWFTGEEQGLWGSEAYAEHLADQGSRVDGMIAMDMISHIASPTGAIDSVSVRLYAQGDGDQGGTASVSRSFQRYLKWVGESYADIDSFEMRIYALTDRPGRGSDHISFSEVGYPSLRVIERNEDLNFQHNGNDLPEHVAPSYARRVAMCTFGGLLTMLMAPARAPAPEVEQLSANIARITIPDSVVLPEGGRFYLCARGWYDAYHDSIFDLGTARTFEYSVSPGELFAFSISRADVSDLPSPFSTETVLEALPANQRSVPLPSETSLSAVPNPFNANVMFNLQLMESGHVTLSIFDLLGRQVATLVDEQKTAGMYHVPWSPSGLASGIYLARLIASEETHIIKVAYLR